MSAEADSTVFMLPTAPAGPWDQPAENEQTWIAFIRVTSGMRGPSFTHDSVREPRQFLDAR